MITFNKDKNRGKYGGAPDDMFTRRARDEAINIITMKHGGPVRSLDMSGKKNFSLGKEPIPMPPTMSISAHDYKLRADQAQEIKNLIHHDEVSNVSHNSR